MEQERKLRKKRASVSQFFRPGTILCRSRREHKGYERCKRSEIRKFRPGRICMFIIRMSAANVAAARGVPGKLHLIVWNVCLWPGPRWNPEARGQVDGPHPHPRV